MSSFSSHPLRAMPTPNGGNFDCRGKVVNTIMEGSELDRDTQKIRDMFNNHVQILQTILYLVMS